MKITLPIYYTQSYKTKADKKFLIGMNWYRNAHHVLSNNIKQHYHELVHAQLGDLKYSKIRLHYVVYVQRKNTDGHNIRAVIEKFFLDGLVEGNHIPDDSIDYVLGDSSEYRLDKDNPRIEIDIIEQ